MHGRGHGPTGLLGLALLTLGVCACRAPEPEVHLAVRVRDHSHLQALLAADRGAASRRDERSGSLTPLFLALRNCDGVATRLLLDADARPNATSRIGPEFNKVSPLCQAIRCKDSELVAALLAAGASIDLRERMSLPPVSIAAEQSDPGPLALLLEAGADPDESTQWGRGSSSDRVWVTPLKEAAESGRVENTRLLLQAHADPELAAPNDDRPLHAACSRRGVPDDRREIVFLLLAAGADVNAQGHRRRTPLHCAVEGSLLYHPTKGETSRIPASIEVIDLLLAAGADLSARDASGRTPEQRARATDQPKLARHLRAAGVGSSPDPTRPETDR